MYVTRSLEGFSAKLPLIRLSYCEKCFALGREIVVSCARVSPHNATAILATARLLLFAEDGTELNIRSTMDKFANINRRNYLLANCAEFNLS